jgi:hypothetical protein
MSKIFRWASRCVPGFSIIALLWLSYAALFQPLPGRASITRPSFLARPPAHRPEELTLNQKIYIAIFLFVHVNAFCFALRLFFSLFLTLRECKRLLERRPKLNPKLLRDVVQDAESDQGEEILLHDIEASSTQSESKSLLLEPEVIHAIILPNYKEDTETLRTTLHVLASHPRASSQYEVSLHWVFSF